MKTTYSALAPSHRRRRPWEYRTRSAPGGLPWVHICIGGSTETGYRLGVARGVIALGDVAIGLVAFGGIAVGLLAVGGVALGLAALAGVSLGLLAVGGLAIGVTALGAVAIGVAAHGSVTALLPLVRLVPPSRRRGRRPDNLPLLARGTNRRADGNLTAHVTYYDHPAEGSSSPTVPCASPAASCRTPSCRSSSRTCSTPPCGGPPRPDRLSGTRLSRGQPPPALPHRS